MSELFGRIWEESPAAQAGADIITKYSNKDIGEFYAVTGALRFQSVNTPELTNIILPLIREKYLSKRPYVICFEQQKAIFSTFNSGNVTPLSIEEIPNEFPTNITDRITRILLNFYRLNPEPAAEITNFSYLDFFSSNDLQMVYFFEMMTHRDLIQGKVTKYIEGGILFVGGITIGENGWQTLEEIGRLRGINSRQAFIAMWFHDFTNDVYNAIDSAVRSVGFIPLRIDLKEHNNEISGEILYEIGRSRFIIADVTGQRQGVYFEAGYAMGLGIPVIWSCREDEIGKVHFDTRQYNHVIWNNVDTLTARLVGRIKGTIMLR